MFFIVGHASRSGNQSNNDNSNIPIQRGKKIIMTNPQIYISIRFPKVTNTILAV